MHKKARKQPASASVKQTIYEEESAPSPVDGVGFFDGPSGVIGGIFSEVPSRRILQRTLVVPSKYLDLYVVAYKEVDAPSNYYRGGRNFDTIYANGEDGGDSIDDAFAFFTLENARRTASQAAEQGYRTEVRQPVLREDGIYLTIVETFEPSSVESRHGWSARRDAEGKWELVVHALQELK